MLRFIVKRVTFDGIEHRCASFETVDCECPELEKTLRRGGYGGGPNGDGFDMTDLVGAEVLETPIKVQRPMFICAAWKKLSDGCVARCDKDDKHEGRHVDSIIGIGWPQESPSSPTQ